MSTADPNPEIAPDGGAPSMSTSRRVAINTMSNWIAMAIQLGANMFLLAYMLRYLDEVRFGIFRLAVTISVGVSFLSFGMAASVLRLASESIAAKDWDRLSGILSVSRTILVIAAAVGLLGAGIVAAFFLDVLKVPREDQAAAAGLIMLTAVATAMKLVAIVYDGMLRAKQRYDLMNGVVVAETLFQVVGIVGCFELGWVSLEAIGLTRVGMAVMALAAFIVMAHRLLPQARLSFGGVGRGAVRTVASLNAWTAVKMLTRVVLEQAAVPIASATLGVAAVTALAIPQLMSQYLGMVVFGLTLTVWPVAAKYAVQGQREDLARLYRILTRLAMMLLVPALAVLVTHGQPFIRGLKPELEWSYGLMLVYMGLFLVRGAVMPADHVILASGAVRNVALSQAAAMAVGLPLSLAVAVWTDWGLYGITIALFAPFALQGLLYLPYRIWKETGVRIFDTFWGCMAGPLVGGIVPLAVGWALMAVWPPPNLAWVLVQMGACGAAYVAAAWLLILTAEERGLMLRLVRRSRPAGGSGGAVPPGR